MKEKRGITYFINIIHQTLTLVFPFILIGSCSKIIADSFFYKEGYFYQIFHLNQTIDYLKAWHYSFKSLSEFTLGIISLFIAYKIASLHYSQCENKNHNEFVGFTSVVCFLIITAKYNNQLFGEMTLGNLGYRHIFLAIIVGFIVASLFIRIQHITWPKRYAHLTSFRLVLALLLTIFISFFINKVWLALYYLTKNTFSHFLLSFLGQMTSWWQSIIAGLIYVISLWFGCTFLPLQMHGVNSDNMQAVLTHHTPPYTYDYFTLFVNYGMILFLALVFVMMWYHPNKKTRLVSKWCLVPTLFSQPFSLFIGVPIMFNKKYLLPLLGGVTLNMLLASLLLALHILPVSAYPILIGTPLMMTSYITTNGNMLAFSFSLVLLLIDIFFLKKMLYSKGKVE